jgi:hypothetical protein
VEERKLNKGESEESEEVDDIELIFTTEETREMTLQEDLVPIEESWEPSMPPVETDISKCGVSQLSPTSSGKH